MASMADEFRESRYQPKYEFMARVQGVYKGIPFVGSVGNDTVIAPDIGPVYHIHLDLPMRLKDKTVINILCCKHSDIKNLKRR